MSPDIAQRHKYYQIADIKIAKYQQYRAYSAEGKPPGSFSRSQLPMQLRSSLIYGGWTFFYEDVVPSAPTSARQSSICTPEGLNCHFGDKERRFGIFFM